MNKNSVKKGLFYFFILAVLVNGYFIFATETKKNMETLGNFEWLMIPLVLLLVLVNFLLRELKWDFFRVRADIVWDKPIPRLGSWLIFFSGYSMCISPGRIGELIKPGLYKEYYNSPLKKAVPLVFCERITDLLGMVLMCLLTMGFYFRDVRGFEEGIWSNQKLIILFILSTAFLGSMIAIARWRRLVEGILARVSGVPKMAKISDKLLGLYRATYPLLTFFNLTTMSVFAAFSWFFECLAMYAVCHGLGITDLQGGPVGLFHCMFIFCMSSILGAVAFVFPGGMGPVEILMKAMLVALGVAAAPAVACMFLTRMSTLIFGAAIGFVVLGITARYHRDSDLWGHLTEAVESDDKGEAASA